MIKAVTIISIQLICVFTDLQAPDSPGPDTVTVPSGQLVLKALLWHPSGEGPFPGIVYCHGSYKDTEAIRDPTVGPLFAKKGYIFLFLFRRGVGLSKGQGLNSTDLMDEALKDKGQEERNNVQLHLLDTDQLQDMVAGIKFLNARNDVDQERMAVVGASFGGALALLLAEHEPKLKAAVLFTPVGGPGHSWDRSHQLRMRLITAAKNISAPIMIVYAQNDYSLAPGYALDSVMNQFNKPHFLKIYSSFGSSQNEAHKFVFLSPGTWEADVFTFLSKNLRR